MLDVNDSIVSLNDFQHSLLLVRSLVELRSTRGSVLLGVAYGRHLLLHKQLEDLCDVLVKEVGISDKLFELKDTVQEATSNLTGHLSMDILDREVNSVTNELNFLGTILNGIKLTKVDFREADLLDGGGLLRLVLNRSLLLLSGHSLEGVVVNDGLLGSLTSALSTLTVVLTTASATLTISSAVLSLVLTTTASTLVVSSSGVVSVLSLSLVHVTSMVLLHTADALHHVLLFGSLVLTVSEPVEHLSLFAGVLLVLEFLLRYPEVNGDRSVAEGGTLIKHLDGVLGMINVFVENESLLV
jgi:hypothetical protein